MMMLNVLMLEDNPDDALLLQRELRRAGFQPRVTIVQTEQDFLKHLSPNLDVILADSSLPTYSGERALEAVFDHGLDIPFILISGAVTEDEAIGMVDRGAFDYLLKDRLPRLGAAVKRALDERNARSKHTRTERELELSEQRFRRMFEVSLDVILFIDADDGTILDANPAVESVLGYETPELIGEHWSALFPPNMLPTESEVRVSAASGGTVIMTHMFMRADGSLGAMDMTVTSIDWGDSERRLLVTLRDVTERMRADTERINSQNIFGQLERERLLNEQRQRFINFAAHEFKNPLAAIRSSNTLLQEYGERMSESARRKHYDAIEDQIQRMMELISDLLTVGRLSDGTSSMNRERIDLGTFTQAMVDEFRKIYPTQPFRCEIELGMYEIDADPKLLHQMIANVLSNAARYSPDKRMIIVHLGREGDTLTLHVTDQGIGIQPQDLPILFEPFRRGSNVGGIGGTGLGLNIVKQTVEMHGGTVEVESTAGQGATFTIRLPAANRK